MARRKRCYPLQQRNLRSNPQCCAMKISIDRMIALMGALREILAIIVPLLKKKENVPTYVNSGMDTLAIRMATSKEIEKIIELVGSPLFMTSANQSGEKTCTSLDEIEIACPLISGMLIGDTKFGESSTIVDASSNEIKVLRQGPITIEQINKVLEEE